MAERMIADGHMIAEPKADADANANALPGGWRGWLFGIFIVLALGGAIYRWGEVERFLALLGEARPGWLLLAVALQMATYASVATGWRLVLRSAGVARPLWPLMRIAVLKLLADQAVPSAGMGGNVVLIDQLQRLEVPRGAAVAALLVSMIGFYAAYALLAVLTLGLLWLNDQATPLLAGVVTLFLAVAFAIPALALWLRRKGSAQLPTTIARFSPIRGMLKTVGEAPAHLVRDRRLVAGVAGMNLLVFLADAGTLLACLAALGHPAPPATALIALVMASIGVTLGPVPLGLGSFEAISTAMLHLLGVPVEVAFAGTMLLRLFTLWLPLLPGLWMMRAATRGRRPPASTAYEDADSPARR